MIHLIIRSVCLLLLVAVLIKQYRLWRRLENGEKELRKQLIGNTLGMIMIVIATTLFVAKNEGLLDIIDVGWLYLVVSLAIALISFTWFWIYFVED